MNICHYTLQLSCNLGRNVGRNDLGIALQGPSNIYNMSGRVVSDIQTRAEGESLYI